jgi:hypothetical protein
MAMPCHFITYNKPFAASFSAPVTRVRALLPYFYAPDRLTKNLIWIDAVGLNFGVQVAWIVLSWCTLVLFQLFMRRRSARAHKAEIAAAAAAAAAAESFSEKQGA